MKPSILFLGSLLAVGTTLLFAADARKPLTEEQRILHLLNRLGFGPRPGDVEKVRKLGVRAYIEQQLNPERIPDPEADRRLAAFKTLPLATIEELDKAHPVAALEGERARGNAFRMEKDEKPLPPFVPGAGRALPASADPAKSEMDVREFREAARARSLSKDDLGKAQLVRTVYSERQLLEVMAAFWVNHFFVGGGRGESLFQDYVEHTIRPRALGKFEDLLKATAQTSTMMMYLDNWRSAAPVEVIHQRLTRDLQPTLTGPQRRQLRATADSLQEFKGLNENYARELMELHTLGVEGGYTQQDVIAVAKVLTGWTVTEWDENGGRISDRFVFNPVLHESGDKTVLGKTIKAGGKDEGMEVLTMLAKHPSTARHISTKLTRRFVADDPPAAIVEAGAQAFLKTDGDIRQVLRAILTHPNFFAPQHYQGKFKKPSELIASALRAASADLTFPPQPRRRGQGQAVGINTYLGEMGEVGKRTPEGYADVASAWVNSNMLLKRMEFANALASGEVPGIALNFDMAKRMINELELPAPNEQQSAMIRDQMTQARKRKAAASSPAGQAPSMMSADPTAGNEAVISPAAIALSYALASPQFQKK